MSILKMYFFVNQAQKWPHLGNAISYVTAPHCQQRCARKRKCGIRKNPHKNIFPTCATFSYGRSHIAHSSPTHTIPITFPTKPILHPSTTRHLSPSLSTHTPSIPPLCPQLAWLTASAPPLRLLLPPQCPPV